MRTQVLKLQQWLFRRSAAQHPPGPVILMYDAVIRSPLPFFDGCFLDEQRFRQRLDFVRKHFEVLPLFQTVVRSLAGHLHRPTVAITFDGGLQTNHDFAFPILRERCLPAMLFVVSDLLNSDDTLWYCRLLRALWHTSKNAVVWHDELFDPVGSKAEALASHRIQERLKQFHQPRWQVERRQLVQALGEDPADPIPPDSPFRTMGTTSLEAPVTSGLIENGAHRAMTPFRFPSTSWHPCVCIERSF